jgi:coenzyme F420-reducing hydrogenase beta subunit
MVDRLDISNVQINWGIVYKFLANTEDCDTNFFDGSGGIYCVPISVRQIIKYVLTKHRYASALLPCCISAVVKFVKNSNVDSFQSILESSAEMMRRFCVLAFCAANYKIRSYKAQIRLRSFAMLHICASEGRK